MLRTRPRRALDHAFAVETNAAAVRDHLDELFCGLPEAADGAVTRYRLLADPPDAPTGVTVAVGEERIATGAHPARGLGLLARHVNATALRRAQDCVLVHAGVVARDGRAVVLPGASGAGKTTLVAALLRAGFQYLSDEAAVLRRDGRLWPYAKPLAISPGAHGLFADLRSPPAPLGLDDAGEWLVPAHRIAGSDVWARPAPAGAVVVFAYEPAAPTRLEALPRARALMALMEHGIGAEDRHPPPGRSTRPPAGGAGPRGAALHRLAALTARSRTWALTYADATEAAALLADACVWRPLTPRRGRASAR